VVSGGQVLSREEEEEKVGEVCEDKNAHCGMWEKVRFQYFSIFYIIFTFYFVIFRLIFRILIKKIFF
jgi:hypothetical protein